MPHRVPHHLRAEYRALVQDGLVRPVLGDDVVVPADVPDCPAVRAAAVAVHVPGTLLQVGVVHGTSAAWVLVGGEAPRRVSLALPARLRRRSATAVHLRQVDVPEAEQVRYGGLMLTGPVRTAADVARELPAHDAVPWLDRLAALGARAPEVLACLSTLAGRRGVKRARGLVVAWSRGEADPSPDPAGAVGRAVAAVPSPRARPDRPPW